MKTYKAIWLQGVTCNGNSHSFLNYTHLNHLLKNIEFLFHPSLPSKYDHLNFDERADILIVEGGIKEGFLRDGKNFIELFQKFAFRAKFIVCVGSCAVYGGIFKEYDDNISGVLFDRDKRSFFYEEFVSKAINIPGCPANGEWIGYVLNSIILDREILLDRFKRPKEIFAFSVHSGCDKNEYFEWKVDAKSFGEKEGCLFYEQGCQAPFTHGDCNKRLWNEVNSKTRAGMPCIGCTEPDFPKKNLFKTKTYMGIPANLPLGVSKRAYLTLTGIAKSFKIDRLNRNIFEDEED